MICCKSSCLTDLFPCNHPESCLLVCPGHIWLSILIQWHDCNSDPAASTCPPRARNQQSSPSTESNLQSRHEHSTGGTWDGHHDTAMISFLTNQPSPVRCARFHLIIVSLTASQHPTSIHRCQCLNMRHIGACWRGHCNLSGKEKGRWDFLLVEVGGCGLSDLTRKPPSLLPPLTGAVPERIAALKNVFANWKTTHTRKVTCYSRVKSTLVLANRAASSTTGIKLASGWLMKTTAV